MSPTPARPATRRRDALRRVATIGAVLATVLAATAIGPAAVAAEPLATKTGLTLSSNEVLVGEPVVATATVTADGVVPAGSIEFRANDGWTESVPLVDGVAALQFDDLPAGGYWIVASFTGDGFSPSRTARWVRVVEEVPGLVSHAPVRIEHNQQYAGPTPVCLQVAGVNGVPEGATGVVLNATVVAPYQEGYLVIYPDSGGTLPAPATSTVNFEIGREVANAAFVALPANGRICYSVVAALATVILDATGYVLPGSGIELQNPVRLFDTRDRLGPVAPGSVHTVQVTGRAGVPAGATAVILNATVTGTTSPGNLRIFPAGNPVPNASVVNYAPSVPKANLAVVALSPDGTISFKSDAVWTTAHVILDVAGYVTPGSDYRGEVPTRVLDTRQGAGQVGSLVGPLKAMTEYTIELPGALVPAGATSVILNVTAIAPSSLGNLRVYPSGTGFPDSSTVNYIPGRDIPNLVVVALPDDGPPTLTLYSDTALGQTVHVAADVAGFVVAP